MFTELIHKINLIRSVNRAVIALVLPGQFILCLKARKAAVRLLPIIIISALTAIFAVLAFTGQGSDAVAYLFLLNYCICMLIMCAAGWLVWLVYKNVRSII